MVCIGLFGGLLLGLLFDTLNQPAIQTVYAEEKKIVVEPEVVLIEIAWGEESIIKKIKNTFPEDPETAVKIARCESGLKMIQSNHLHNGVQEPSYGIFQIHKPSWERKAKELGYWNYQTDVEENIKMARYIYDNAGKTWKDWSCYTKKMI
jgi:hypothetical protein